MSLRMMLTRAVLGAVISTAIACAIAIIGELPQIEDARAVFSLCVFLCVIEAIIQSIRIEQRTAPQQ